nr:hypothetical protein [Pseudoroseomonas ludipueritiae]
MAWDGLRQRNQQERHDAAHQRAFSTRAAVLAISGVPPRAGAVLAWPLPSTPLPKTCAVTAPSARSFSCFLKSLAAFFRLSLSG